MVSKTLKVKMNMKVKMKLKLHLNLSGRNIREKSKNTTAGLFGRV
jgi:hypothetical protein